MLSANLKQVIGFVMWLFTELLGWIGGILILYTVISALSKETFDPVERNAPFLSSILTIIGAFLTAMSVYFPSDGLRPPWKHSKYFFSPIIMIGAAVAFGLLIYLGA